MNTKTNNPTVPELLSMSPEELVEHWYERTQHGVQKLVNPLITQLDLSAIAILKRAGIDPTVESINSHFLFDGGNVKLVELDTENPISEDNTEDGSDLIDITGILDNGLAIEITFWIEYISKFPNDPPEYGHIVPEYIKSTDLHLDWSWKTFRPFDYTEFYTEDEEFIEEEAIAKRVNGKLFVSRNEENPGYISVEYTEQTN